ncbi:14865_t:CDS:2 [Gigaspora margarita]|uniref:14865_t:CDS:1 n=1 Tax=Gigaspora margarita TaxID=4874 RepID=A0ABN7UQC3_GIGMA|nr:14865_t:CDS:2 [Gigaspora margarita]
MTNNATLDLSYLDLNNHIFNYPGFNDLNQLNASYCKSKNAIIINKLVKEYNHSLAPYRKEFALSLRSISQEVLDTIKFLTQEYNLRVKAQCQYLSKKFSDQLLYDHNLYNTMCRYGKQMGNKRKNDAADIDEIEKYLTSESVFAQNTQISQSTIADHETSIEMNQVISIRGPDQEYTHGFGIAKSRLKFAIDNGLVDEFVGLITRFIKNHTGVNTRSNFVQQDILQNLNIEQEETLRPTKRANIEINNNNI